MAFEADPHGVESMEQRVEEQPSPPATLAFERVRATALQPTTAYSLRAIEKVRRNKEQ
jgi:hypothetical protein